MKTLLKSATIVTGQKIFESDILIEDRKITKISSSINEKNAKEINCQNKLVMPGMIDTHVHFRDPGLTHKGDSLTESIASVAGGVTTICDMPNTLPQTTTMQKVEEKKQIFAKKCLCNFGIYIGAEKNNLEELKKASQDKAVPAIKIFMAESTGEMTLYEDKYLEPIFSQTQKLIATHAEDEKLRLRRLEQFRNKELPESNNIEENEPYQHAIIRNNQVAFIGTKRAIELAIKHKHNTHILHVSTKEEISIINKEVKKGYVTAETCPQYIYFDKESIKNYAGFRIINPALKTKYDSIALLQALNEGVISQYATDHAPHLQEEKKQPYGRLPAGLPSIQFSLPLLLHLCYQKKISLEKIVQIYAENPAKNFKISNKGFIKEGYDADITIVDPKKTLYVSSQIVLSKCGWTPYEQMALMGGIVEKTFVNGDLVYNEGKINTEKKGEPIEVLC